MNIELIPRIRNLSIDINSRAKQQVVTLGGSRLSTVAMMIIPLEVRPRRLGEAEESRRELGK